MTVDLKTLAYLLAILAIGGAAFRFLLTGENRKLVGLRPILVPLAMIAVGMFCGNAYFFFAVLAVVLPIASRTREEAAALFVALFLAIPQLSYPVVIGGSFIFAFGTVPALSVGMAITWLARRGAVRRTGARNDVIFLLFFLIMLVSSARGREPVDMLRETAQALLLYAVPYWFVSRSLNDMVAVRRVVLVFAMWGFMLGLEAFYEARGHWPLYLPMYGRLHVNDIGMVWMKMRAGFLRAPSSFQESTSLSIFLALAFVAAVASAPAFRSRVMHWAALGGAGLGLLATQSRGGWLAAAAGLLIVDLYRSRYATLFAKVAMIGAAGMLLIFAAASSPRLSQTLGLSGGALQTVQYRQALFTRGMEEFRTAPVIGQDAKTVTDHLGDMRQGEGIVDFVNGYLFFALTEGVVGVVLLVAAFLAPALLLFARRKRQPGGAAETAIGAFLFAAVLVPLVVLTGTSLTPRPAALLVLVFALIAAFLAATGKRQASATQQAEVAVPAPETELVPA